MTVFLVRNYIHKFGTMMIIQL